MPPRGKRSGRRGPRARYPPANSANTPSSQPQPTPQPPQSPKSPPTPSQVHDTSASSSQSPPTVTPSQVHDSSASSSQSPPTPSQVHDRSTSSSESPIGAKNSNPSNPSKHVHLPSTTGDSPPSAPAPPSSSSPPPSPSQGRSVKPEGIDPDLDCTTAQLAPSLTLAESTDKPLETRSLDLATNIGQVGNDPDAVEAKCETVGGGVAAATKGATKAASNDPTSNIETREDVLVQRESESPIEAAKDSSFKSAAEQITRLLGSPEPPPEAISAAIARHRTAQEQHSKIKDSTPYRPADQQIALYLESAQGEINTSRAKAIGEEFPSSTQAGPSILQSKQATETNDDAEAVMKLVEQQPSSLIVSQGVDDVTDIIVQLTTENKRLKARIKEQENIVNEVVSNVTADNVRVKKNAAECVASMNSLIANLRAEIESMALSGQDLSTEKHSASPVAARADPDASSEDVPYLKQELEATRAKFAELETKSVNTAAQKASLKQELNTLKAELATAKASVAENSIISEEVLSLKATLTNTTVNLEESRKANLNLTTELEKANSERIKLSDLLSTHRDNAGTAIQQLEEEVASLRESVELGLWERARLEMQIAEKTALPASDDDAVSKDGGSSPPRRKQEVSAKETEMADIRHQNEHLQLKLQIAEDLAHAAEAEVAALRKRQVEYSREMNMSPASKTRSVRTQSIIQKLERSERECSQKTIEITQLQGEIALKSRQLEERISDITRLKALVVKQNQTFATMDRVQDSLQSQNQELKLQLTMLSHGGSSSGSASLVQSRRALPPARDSARAV